MKTYSIILTNNHVVLQLTELEYTNFIDQLLVKDAVVVDIPGIATLVRDKIVAIIELERVRERDPEFLEAQAIRKSLSEAGLQNDPDKYKAPKDQEGF